MATSLVSADSINLGAICIAEGVSGKFIEITANDNAPLVIKNFVIPDTMAERGVTMVYLLKHTLPDTIQPGEKRVVLINAKPNIPLHLPSEDYIGTATIETDDPLFSSIPIRIFGHLVTTAVGANPASINFGDVPVDSKVVRTIELSPEYCHSVTITDLKFDFGNDSQAASEFSFYTPHLPMSLSGAHITVWVYYTPRRVEPKDIALVVVADATEDKRIPIIANGIQVGVEEAIASGNQTFLYPQPATSVVYIQYTTTVPDPLTMQLFSAEGRFIATVLDAPSIDAGTHHEPFSVEHLPVGMYFCRITTQAGVETRPVLVMH